MNKRFIISFLAILLCLSFAFKVFTSQEMSIIPEITVGIDQNTLRKLSPCLDRKNFGRDLTFENFNKSSPVLPAYPVSHKIISAADRHRGISIYETSASILIVKGYYIREMQYQGWRFYKQAYSHSGMLLFRKEQSVCMVYLENHSGQTDITIVYQLAGQNP